jgi:hypothetical protein
MIDFNILIVCATLLGVASLSSIVSSWAGGVRPGRSVLYFMIAIGIFIYIYMSKPDGLAPLDVPDAFIEVLALILN